jgi:hypothetical protein
MKCKPRLWKKKYLLMLFASVLFSSCTANISREIKYPALEHKTAIPLKAALYPKPPLQNFTLYHGGFTVNFNDALAHGAEETLRYTFKEVMVLNATGENTSGQGYDVMVVPELKKFDLVFKPPSPVVCSINMKWTVFDNSGKTIYMNEFWGDGQHDKIIAAGMTRIESCFEMAIKDLFGKVGDGLHAGRWWDNH